MRTYPLLILILFTFACAGPQVKDEKSLQKAKEKALKGDEKSIDAMAAALEEPPPEDEPNLHEKIVEELGEIPTEKSREVLGNAANAEDESTREKAITALYKHSKTTDDEYEKTDIEYTVLNEIDDNYDTYGKLTPAEIEVLGNIEEYRSIDTLNLVLYRQPEDASIILRSLTKHLSDQDSSVAEEARIAIEDFILSDANPQAKEIALLELYNAYHPDSEERLLQIYNKPGIRVEDQALILKVLGKKSPEFYKHWEKKLKEDYAKASKTERPGIITTYAAIKNITQQQAKKELDQSLPSSGPVLSLARAKRLKAMNPKTAVYEILKKYKFTQGDIDTMDNALQNQVKVSDSKHDTISAIIFAGLQKLHPDKNYFELKKIAAEGFSHKGLAFAVFETIYAAYENDDLRAVAARKLFHISMEKALSLMKAYGKEREYFRYISR